MCNPPLQLFHCPRWVSWSLMFTSTKSLNIPLMIFLVLTSSCSFSKTSEVVRTSNSFSWTHVHFFVAISTVFFMFENVGELWRLLSLAVGALSPGEGKYRDHEWLPRVIATASMFLNACNAFLDTYSICVSGQSSGRLKPFTKWEVVLLSRKVFMSVENNSFLTASIRVSWLKHNTIFFRLTLIEKKKLTSSSCKAWLVLGGMQMIIIEFSNADWTVLYVRCVPWPSNSMIAGLFMPETIFIFLNQFSRILLVIQPPHLGGIAVVVFLI